MQRPRAKLTTSFAAFTTRRTSALQGNSMLMLRSMLSSVVGRVTIQDLGTGVGLTPPSPSSPPSPSPSSCVPRRAGESVADFPTLAMSGHALAAEVPAHTAEQVRSRSRPRWHHAVRSLVQVCIVVVLSGGALLAISFSGLQTMITHVAPTHMQPLPPDHLLSQSSRRLSIFGKDDRRAISDTSLYPYSAVGLLYWGKDGACTASLISSTLVVTAASCVLTKAGGVDQQDLQMAEFRVAYGAPSRRHRRLLRRALGDDEDSPNHVEQAAARIVRVHRQSAYWKNWSSDTYVILELDTPLGDSHGILSLPTLNDLDSAITETPVQMVGFSDDATTSVAGAALRFAKCTCFFPVSFGGPRFMLHHDCDTVRVGSPGSPLLVRYTSMETYIIGVHYSAGGDGKHGSDRKYTAYSDDVANRGVLGPFIHQHLEYLLQELAARSDASGGGSSSNTNANASTGTVVPPGGQQESSPMESASGGNAQRQEGDVQPATGESKSTSSGGNSIGSVVGYACIGIVAGAWACILLIGVRHMRRQ